MNIPRLGARLIPEYIMLNPGHEKCPRRWNNTSIALQCREMSSWPSHPWASVALSGVRNSFYFCFPKSFVPFHPSRAEKLYFSVFISELSIPYLVTIASFSPKAAEIKAAAHPRTDFLPGLTKFCINNARVFFWSCQGINLQQSWFFSPPKKNCWQDQLKYFGSIM